MKLKVGLACLCLFAGLGLQAWGQSYRTFRDDYDRIVKDISLTLGPLRILPLFKIRDLGYDDNLYANDSQNAPVKDYTATLSPEVRVFFPLRNSLILSFSDNPEYAFFLREKHQRALTHSFALGIKYLFLSRFVLSGDFISDQRRLRVSSELPVPAMEAARTYRVGFFYETARKTSLGFVGSVQKLRYDDFRLGEGEIPLSRVLNREERSGSLELHYRISEASTFFLKAGTTDYRFEQDVSARRNAAESHILSGVQFPLAGRIRGTISLGYKRFIPKFEGGKSYAGVYGTSEAELRSGRFALRAAYLRDIVFSYYAEVLYYVDSSTTLGGSFYVTRFLRLDYNFSQGRAEYPEPVPVMGVDGELLSTTRSDRHQFHSVGCVVRLFRTTGLGLVYTAAQWTSNLPGFDRPRSFLGIVLTQQF